MVCVTETWFSDYVPYQSILVDIPGFNSERKDRKGHAAGVACYVDKRVQYKRLVELEGESHKMLWLNLNPNKLP